jgi:hypothetical protein
MGFSQVSEMHHVFTIHSNALLAITRSQVLACVMLPAQTLTTETEVQLCTPYDLGFNNSLIWCLF